MSPDFIFWPLFSLLITPLYTCLGVYYYPSPSHIFINFYSRAQRHLMMINAAGSSLRGSGGCYIWVTHTPTHRWPTSEPPDLKTQRTLSKGPLFVLITASSKASTTFVITCESIPQIRQHSPALRVKQAMDLPNNHTWSSSLHLFSLNGSATPVELSLSVLRNGDLPKTSSKWYVCPNFCGMD